MNSHSPRNGAPRTVVRAMADDPEPHIHAVLTGDFVSSEAMQRTGDQTLGDLLRAATAEAGKIFDRAGLSEVDVFRGDSWQLLVRDPGEALAVGLFLRAWVRAQGPSQRPYWDTRVGLGLGRVERLDEARISESEGPAFVASGEALDALQEGPASQRPRFGVVGAPAGLPLDLVASLVDTLVQHWTPKQAWAVIGRFSGDSHERIGRTFEPPISKQAVRKHLDRAGEQVVFRACAWFRDSLQTPRPK